MPMSDVFLQVKTVEQLREVLEMTFYRSSDEPWDRAKHFNAEWADRAMRDMYCPCPSYGCGVRVPCHHRSG